MENNISIEISPEALANITAAVATIKENLPPLLNLSPDERQELPKMGDKTLAFVSKALGYAQQNPDVVPSFLDVAEFKTDLDAVDSLKTVFNPLKQLTESLDDMLMMAGSESYMAALVFYNAVKGAAKAGLPGMKTIYDDLKNRFTGNGAKTNGPEVA